MKKGFYTIIIILFFFAIPTLSYAQQTNPGDPGGEPGGGGEEPPLGAPIGSGLYILLGLGAAYGARKTYQFYNEKINLQ
jgi:hypothetical protein